MHYFTPKRCATSNKIMYHDKAQAQRAADQSLIERGAELWVYRCEYCGCWHLTHRDPQSSYRHVPLNQQLKPHSRKKGISLGGSSFPSPAAVCHLSQDGEATSQSSSAQSQLPLEPNDMSRSRNGNQHRHQAVIASVPHITLVLSRLRIIQSLNRITGLRSSRPSRSEGTRKRASLPMETQYSMPYDPAIAECIASTA